MINGILIMNTINRWLREKELECRIDPENNAVFRIKGNDRYAQFISRNLHYLFGNCKGKFTLIDDDQVYTQIKFDTAESKGMPIPENPEGWRN